MDDSDHSLIDHTATANLESLWTEDNSRSAEFFAETVTSSTDSSASLDSTIANATTHSTTPVSSYKSSDENPKGDRKKRSVKNYNVDKYLGSVLQNFGNRYQQRADTFQQEPRVFNQYVV